MLLGTQALLVVHLLHEMDLFLDWSHWTSIYDSPVRLSLWLVVKSTRNPPKIFIKPPSYPIDIPFTSHWLVYFPSEMSGAAAATHRASHIRSTRVGIPGSTGQEGGFWWDNLVALGQIFSGIDYQNYIHMLQYHRVSIYTPYINIYINICKYIYIDIYYIDGLMDGLHMFGRRRIRWWRTYQLLWPTSSNDSGPTRMIQVDAAPRSWPLYWDLEKHFKIHWYKMV